MKASQLRTRYTGPIAERYDSARQNLQKWKVETEAVESLLSKLTPGARLLDVPVGTGRFIGSYQSLGLHATGVDASNDMLAQARLKIDPSSSPITLVQGDLFQVDFASSAFDCVVCMRFLNWIAWDEFEKAIGQLVRATKSSLILGVRTYASWADMRDRPAFAIRQLGRRLLGFGGLVVHERPRVLGLFSELGLAVEQSLLVEIRQDGTAYHIYKLVKRP